MIDNEGSALKLPLGIVSPDPIVYRKKAPIAENRRLSFIDDNAYSFTTLNRVI